MEGTLQRVQRVKGLLTALASQLISKIKDEIDSTTAMINHVMQSVKEALLSLERIDQKLSEEVSRIKEKNVEERSDSFQTSHQSVEVLMPCRRENNDEEEEESEFDDLNSAMGSSNYIQVDEHEFPDSKFQDMAKDEVAGEDVGDVDISK